MTVDFRSSFWQIHHVHNVHLLEDKIQDWGMHLLTISYGSYAMDQRSGDGWISGWSKIFVFCKEELLVQTLSCSTRELLQHWTKSSRIPASRKRSVWRKWKLTKKTVSFEEGRSLTWSINTSGSLGPTILSRIMRTYLQLFFEMMNIQEFDSEMGQNSIVNDENPIWWHLGRIVQIQNTRVWETHLIITDWRQWWKEVSSRIYELRNFEARNGNYERNAVIKNQGTKQREQRSLGDCWQWKANG